MLRTLGTYVIVDLAVLCPVTTVPAETMSGTVTKMDDKSMATVKSATSKTPTVPVVARTVGAPNAPDGEDADALCLAPSPDDPMPLPAAPTKASQAREKKSPLAK